MGGVRVTGATLDRRNLLLLPAVLVLLLLFLGPMAYFFVASFFKVSLFNLVPTWNIGNYQKVAGEYGGPIAYTMGISAVIAIIATVLGYIVAHVIWRNPGRWGAFLLGATLLTLFGGYLVKIFAWKTILGREGIINNTLLVLGLADQPVEILLYSPFAVVLVLVSYLLPFTILPLYGALRAIEPTTLDAARDLGASPARMLWDAVLPRCIPAILTAFSLSFLVSAGDYVTPRLVGGTRSLMMGNFIESQFGLRMNIPLGAAMTYSTMITSIAIIIVVWLTLRAALRPK